MNFEVPVAQFLLPILWFRETHTHTTKDKCIIRNLPKGVEFKYLSQAWGQLLSNVIYYNYIIFIRYNYYYYYISKSCHILQLQLLNLPVTITFQLHYPRLDLVIVLIENDRSYASD